MTEQSKGGGFRFGAIMTLVPLVSAGFGGLQYYRDQQQREFEVVTFYLQNQDTFDPCKDAQFANLNLGMIENIYPNVYAKVVEHVENRASQCDSVTVIAQEQAPAAQEQVAQAPASSMQTGEMQTRSIQIPGSPAAGAPPEPARRVEVPVTAQDVTAFFRNRYDRLASLPGASARRVQEGRYRVLIQISDEEDRALAQSIEAALSGKGSTTTPSIDLVPISVEKPELRYFRESQAADAERLASEIEQAMAAAGSPGEVTASYVGRPGLPPGVMELWLP